MTTTELIHTFLHTFYLPLAGDSIDSTSNKIITNDAILWRFVKEYNQFLHQPLKYEMFEGENKLFIGGAKIPFEKNACYSSNATEKYAIAGKNIFEWKGIGLVSLGFRIKDIANLEIELVKPINEFIK